MVKEKKQPEVMPFIPVEVKMVNFDKPKDLKDVRSPKSPPTTKASLTFPNIDYESKSKAGSKIRNSITSLTTKK